MARRLRTMPILAGEKPTVQVNYPIRILGVDTALRTTGYGLVDFDGRQFKIVDCGVIKNGPKLLMSECLRRLSGGISELIKTYAPDAVSIEGAFYQRNVHSAMMLGASRGAVIAQAATFHLPIYEYSPTQAKSLVTGWGRASKEQIASIISQQTGLNIDHIMLDSTDALALAMCHGYKLTALGGLTPPEPI